MTYGSAHSVQRRQHDTGRHIASWVVAMLGLLAAAIGGYIAVAPEDGTVTINNRTWAASDLSAWGPWLLIVGGGLAGIGMAVTAVGDWRNGASRWLLAAEVSLSFVGVAAVVAGIMSFM